MNQRLLLRRYPSLGACHLSIRWHSPRPLSAAVLVDTDAGHRLRQAASSPGALGRRRSAKSIASSPSARAGVPDTSKCTVDMDGQTAVAIGDWIYEIHASAEGYRHLPRRRVLVAASATRPRARRRPHAGDAARCFAELAMHGRSAQHACTGGAQRAARGRRSRRCAARAAADRPGLADYLRQRDWAPIFSTCWRLGTATLPPV